MDLNSLNPCVYAADMYQITKKSCERVAYGARLIYVFSGDLYATVGSVCFGHLGTGSLLYIPAGKPYKLKCQYLKAAVVSFSLCKKTEKSNSSVALGDFNPLLCEKYDGFEPFDEVIHIPDLESEYESFYKMCEIFNEDDAVASAKVSALLKLSLIKVAELADKNALPSQMTESLDEYIREHSGEEISNTELGAIFGYHPFYISAMLKEKRGITLRQYIISYRIRLAKKLLKFTDKTVAEIAEQTGFSDASYFTKTFKSLTGKTPKAWRDDFKDGFI